MIDKLIINSPFKEPEEHWSYIREHRSWKREDGRRPAGYVIATPNSQSFDDPGIFIPIPLVNKIRPRVKAWREGRCRYSGVTGTTKTLLSHWNDSEIRNNRRLFFCQLEAIETLIWLTEAPDSDKVGIDIPSDGGAFIRWCAKMATGTGKTIVMGMVIAWQILNKIANPQDSRFSKNILIIAPGLTVKSRLHVLYPSTDDNYYREFNIVPSGLMERLRQGKVLIHNWHKLGWESDEQIQKKKSVDKRGAKSNEAYVREVLGEMANTRNIVVINDEAHHAWRVPAESKVKGVKKEELEQSTIWVGGLDRIHAARGILRCFDFTATPMTPSGKKAKEEHLFPWIVSDFGLNDAIESGLVKTPRVVIRDDSKRTKEYKSRLYHLYMDVEVKDDINRNANETEPLPDLLTNAYYLLGKDWLKTKTSWVQSGQKVPPVMITVANRTETAARIKYAFDHHEIQIRELCNPAKTLHIDSKVLKKAESKDEQMSLEPQSEEDDDESPKDEKPTKQLQAERLRQIVDTVGKLGELGENIQNVISVGMLSEGWDAKTVTHIMGLRAFSSQLLCEQVVGRGLRRTSYDDIDENGMFRPEYVNIFGVPFTFLPHEGGGDTPPPPPQPKTEIKAVNEKKAHEISWPNIVRIDYEYKPELQLDIERVEPIVIDPYQSITAAELSAIVAGKPHPAALTDIDLKNINDQFRLQTIIFEVAKKVYNSEKKRWRDSDYSLLAQLIHFVESFINTPEKVEIQDTRFQEDEKRHRILIMLNVNKIVQHLLQYIRFQNVESIELNFDKENPIRSTSNMRTWYTSKPCEWNERSHVNFSVYDGTWEASEAYRIDKHSNVESWVKNDHLGFEITYNYQGTFHKYRPDFISKLKNGEHLILEVKGQDTKKDQAKRKYLNEWVKAVNNHGGFGVWHWDVSFHPNDLEEKISKHYSKS